MNRIFNFLVIIAMIGVFGQEAPPRKYTEAHLLEVQQLNQQCATENNISNDTMLQFMNNSPGGKIPESRSFSCFLGCVYQAMEYVSPDGQILRESIREKWTTVYTRESVEKVLNSCGSVGGTDLCERSYSLYSCYDDIKTVVEPIVKID
ncbi:general odorant-binding protein 57e-like [Uranotaenia lowii]|uniref:general odorant-binding protein 57e-like n=1 Tax=Uranotaenia lowii TaxID=190385 RepID=UPI002478FFED|nr:general odorant-binding protein 57e-like [Uranotaenia lowii]